jgi:F-type H+-transporting ATPase subunit delta
MFLLQLIILQVIIFGGLIFALRQILTKNISSATSHLDDIHSDFVKREEELKKRQAEAEKYYEDMIAKAKDEVDKMRQEADLKLQEERDKAIEEARAQSEQIVLKAEKTKEMFINDLRSEMDEKNVERLRSLVLAIFPRHLQEELHKLWLSDLFSGDLSRLSHMRIPADASEAKVMTAFALTSEQKSALKKKFKEQLSRDFSLQEEVQPSLIAGLVISIGSLVLDGTLANKIEQIVSQNA